MKEQSPSDALMIRAEIISDSQLLELYYSEFLLCNNRVGEGGGVGRRINKSNFSIRKPSALYAHSQKQMHKQSTPVYDHINRLK